MSRVKRKKGLDEVDEIGANKYVKCTKIDGAIVNKLIKTIEKIKIPVPEGVPPLHTTAVFVGSCNSGKTNWLINYAQLLQDYGSINRIIVMSPTFENNAAFDNLQINSNDIYSGSRVLTAGQECVTEIEAKIKKTAEDYKQYLEYVEAFSAWLRGKATFSQETLVKNNLEQEPEFMERPRILLLMDDLSHTGVFSTGRSNPFINMLLRHRHVFEIGLSIFMAVQNFATGVPKIIRQNCKQFFLWKTHDSTQLELIYEQVAQGCTKEEFYAAFRYATEKPHEFLTVDLNSSCGSVFRRNFDESLVFE